MQNKDFVLGIDTSNYTTSLAITDVKGAIQADRRKILTVKQGERGLRQSHALFQHMENLPEMILELFDQIDKNRIGGVSASNRPRPIEGSYMPVFKAGVNYGKIVAASLGVPFFGFSHQEGHLEAVRHHSILSGETEYLAYHLSGGTCELLCVTKDAIRIIGGSKDLSFGQVIDRTGVALGMSFPSGRIMDQMALKVRDEQQGGISVRCLKKISIDGLAINLSGTETQLHRELEKGADPERLIYELFWNMSDCLCHLTEKAVAETGCDRILFTGGVAASRFVRESVREYFEDKSWNLVFGDPELSPDNAVGTALLGGNALWQSNR